MPSTPCRDGANANDIVSHDEPNRTLSTPRKEELQVETNVRPSLQSAMLGSRHLESTLEFEPNDSDNPRTFSLTKKLLIAFVVILPAFTATLSTPIYAASIPGIIDQFQVSTTLAIMPLSLYALGLGFGALLSTASLEVFGRSIVYRISLPLALVFTIVGGSASTFRTLAVARTLAGLFASPCTTIAVGTLNYLWDVAGDQMGTYIAFIAVLMIVWATQVGFMMGAAIVQDRGWRWTFWVTAILLGISMMTVFLIPETYKPEVLRRRARHMKIPVQRGETATLLFVAVGRPLHMIFTDPIIFPTSLVLGIFQAVLFAFYVAYAFVFETIYSFTAYQVGMAFAPLLVGSVLAIPILGILDKVTYQKAKEKALISGKKVAPEKRLFPTMLSIILLPISLFWFAWTARGDLYWSVPVTSGLLFGIAYVLVMLCLPVYKNDIYGTHYGAPVLAADTFIRFIVSASFPLFTVQMIRKLGIQWAVSVFAFTLIAMIPIPFLLFRWGPWLRARSRYVASLEG